MALGFQIPKINFISIALDGGTDLLKKTDEPHGRVAHLFDQTDETAEQLNSPVKRMNALVACLITRTNLK